MNENTCFPARPGRWSRAVVPRKRGHEDSPRPGTPPVPARIVWYKPAQTEARGHIHIEFACNLIGNMRYRYRIYSMPQLSSYTLPILHSSNLALFQYYSFPILHSSDITLSQSHTLPILHSSNPTLFQSYTLPILHLPILHHSNSTLFQSCTLQILHCDYINWY